MNSWREYLQIISLAICLIIPSFLNFSEKINFLFDGKNADFETYSYYYLMKSGNWSIGFLLMLFVLVKFIRNRNKEEIFNKGNVYHKNSYLWYWFCAKILGYKKCNLILVPISMQYKLVLRDTFTEYPFDEISIPEETIEAEVIRHISKKNVIRNEFNLVLEDTYPITNIQIPKSKVGLATITIIRNKNNTLTRAYNISFVENITKEIRKLPENSTINIFATTNPKHNYEIAKRAIGLADRSNLKNVFVYEQEKDNRRVFKESIKIL